MILTIRMSECQVFGNPNVRISGNPHIRKSAHSEIRTSGNPHIPSYSSVRGNLTEYCLLQICKTECSDFRRCGFPNVRISGCADFRIFGHSDFRKLDIPTFGLSKSGHSDIRYFSFMNYLAYSNTLVFCRRQPVDLARNDVDYDHCPHSIIHLPHVVATTCL